MQGGLKPCIARRKCLAVQVKILGHNLPLDAGKFSRPRKHGQQNIAGKSIVYKNPDKPTGTAKKISKQDDTNKICLLSINYYFIHKANHAFKFNMRKVSSL